MKLLKKLIMYEALVLAFVFLIYFEFLFMASGLVSNAIAEDDKNGVSGAAKNGRTVIKAEAFLRDQTLVVKEEIIFARPVKEVWLNVPANLYAEVNTDNIQSKYQPEIKNDKLAIYISLPDFSSSVSFDYEINLNTKRKILSYNGDKVLLTQFLITPAVVINDKPVLTSKSAFGDPFVYGFYDYEVSLNADEAYFAFAPGKLSDRSEEHRTTYVFKAEAVRDFPVALIKDPDIVRQKINDTDIIYVGMPDVHTDIEKTFAYIEGKTFDYPYKELYVISAPIDSQGMEFSQMIFISDDILNNKETLKRVVQHEVLHQWFYGLIGTDQVNEPFMDEGIVCFLVKDLNGETVSPKYDETLIRFDIAKYKSKAEYYRLAYDGGASLFSSLYENSKGEFDRILRQICLKYKGGILTYDDLINEFNSYQRG